MWRYAPVAWGARFVTDNALEIEKYFLGFMMLNELTN
jgi:hypothetical protein